MPTRTQVILRATSGFNARDYLRALRLQESGGQKNEGIGIMGDFNSSTNKYDASGPYQIHKGFYQDAVRRDKTLGPNKWTKTRDSKEFSERVIDAYNTRYNGKAWERVKRGRGTHADIEQLARTHNGGPKGASRDSTLGYYKAFKEKWDSLEKSYWNPQDRSSMFTELKKRTVAPKALEAGPSDITHTVGKGDSLWKISLEQYGTGARWREIYEYNGLTSDRILPGRTLIIPKDKKKQ